MRKKYFESWDDRESKKRIKAREKGGSGKSERNHEEQGCIVYLHEIKNAGHNP